MASNNMQDIKRRMKSIKSTESITNAMKLVSSAKLRKAKATFERTNEYFHYITDSIAEIFESGGDVPEKYLAGTREVKKTCYIVVSSCKGLCGAFNANVIKATEAEIAQEVGTHSIVAIGTRGLEYFRKRHHEIMSDYSEAPEAFTFTDVKSLSEPIIKMYDEGEIDEVVLVYTSLVSALEQKVKTVKLLPFEPEMTEKSETEKKEIVKLVEYQPSIEAVFNYLVPKYVELTLYAAVIESATCEHAARRMAMENATDNAREMLGQLSLFYNRARQAAITNEIIEVVSGSEAQQ